MAVMPDDEQKRLPDLDVSAWHPRLQRLHDYWKRVHPASGLPGRQHVDPLAIPDLLPNLWLLDVERDPFRLRYRLVGTRITELSGRELTGLFLDEAHPHATEIPDFFRRFRAVVETGQPSWRRGVPTLYLHHKDFTTIERAALPLARDGVSVDMILAMTVFYQPDGTVL
jgi:PAS domain